MTSEDTPFYRHELEHDYFLNGTNINRKIIANFRYLDNDGNEIRGVPVKNTEKLIFFFDSAKEEIYEVI